MTEMDAVDRFDARLALGVGGALEAFNRAGILTTSDVHVALRLAGLGGSDDERVCLGAAFAARAPRLGHVCVDLATIASTASSDLDAPVNLASLPWPEATDWVDRLALSTLVGPARPLHLEGSTVYLDRLWADEGRVASDLLDRAEVQVEVDVDRLRTDLDVLFPTSGDWDLQRLAAAVSVQRAVSVVAGGPGTGKTTTVARVLALLVQQADALGSKPPRIALAAPTGKAAARLEEAVRHEATSMPLEDATKTRLLELAGVTLHRLLGFNPGNRSRFRHNRSNRLPHDVVVVDETSMVSLSMMARVLEAVRADTRLLLVGDHEQLASVEAGAVLGDIVGPVSGGLCMRSHARERLQAVTGMAVPGSTSPESSPIGDGIVVLKQVHRFGGAIATLATSIQEGDADRVMEVLRAGEDSNVRWLPIDASDPGAPDALGEVRELAVGAGHAVLQAARNGEAGAAITALGEFRLLCAHRRGPGGVTTWMTHVQGWLQKDRPGYSGGLDWYVGRPLLVTENDYSLGLYNGDTGVVVAGADGRLVAAFERGGGIVEISPTRLASVDTVYAMTVHKSQGSQFERVAFLLPRRDSPVLTRELLYTAVTRARERLIVVGPEDSIRVAVGRPIARASGLRRALWGGHHSVEETS